MNILYTALSGSAAAQAALTATSQNVANVQTPGYTRQGVNLVSLQTGSGHLAAGSGVMVSSLTRFSDAYKTQQLWQANAGLGQRAAPQQYLTQLEQVMGDDTSSLDNGLDGFFAALNAASVDPASNPLRQQVITAAGALGQRFSSIAQVIADQHTSLNQQRTATVSQVNSLAASIADLNKKIASAQALGGNASGLIDSRDQSVDALANLVAVQVVSQPDGTLSVSLHDGQPLVVNNRASTLTASAQADGTQLLKLAFGTQTFSLGGTSLGGQLGGLDDFESKTLTPLSKAVGDMASAVANQVNTQLAAGYGVNGTPGGPLFDVDTTGASQLLTLHAGVLPEDLGFSSDPTKPGNSDNLLALVALQNRAVNVTSLGSVSLGDANTQLIGNLGMASAQNQALLATAQTVRNQADENWKSTSGVNSDEEAANLVQYQQMYQANMKVIGVASQLFDSVLSMMN
jgi:flagellar hook-associated protein 1 FlgK